MKISPQITFAGVLLLSPNDAAAHIRRHKNDDFRLLNKHERKLRQGTDFASTGGTFTIGGETFQTYEDWIASAQFKANKAACKSKDPTHEEEIVSNYVTEKWKEDNPCDKAGAKNPICREEVVNGRMLSATTTEVIIIDTYFHVIRDSDGNGRHQDAVNENIEVLNNAYSPDFRFNLVNTSFIDNKNYYGADTSTDSSMKQALRQGDCSTLNVYANEPAGGMLGYSTFPNNCKANILDDGVVILDETMPGGTATRYDLGDTLVHEVGHWLGLYHTFQDGCAGGDLIGDTPAENEPSFACEERNTCPNDPGNDPITNYMDYSPDACMNNFTPLQRARMRAQWDEFRFNITHDPPNTDPVCEGDDVMVEITINADNFEQETSWYVTDTCASTDTHYRVVLGSTNPNGGIDQPITKACLSQFQMYTFTIEDTYGDGICCNYGNGTYSIKFDGKFVVEDKKGIFEEKDEVPFGHSTCIATTTYAPVPSPTNEPSQQSPSPTDDYEPSEAYSTTSWPAQLSHSPVDSYEYSD